jgi:hypothetical protein
MPQEIVARGILKGHLLGVVQTRNMFTGQGLMQEDDTIQNLVGAYVGNLISTVLPLLSPLATFESIEVETGPAPWNPVAEIVLDGINGTGSGAILPNLVAAVLIGKTATARGTGRKFFSGLLDTALTENSIAVDALLVLADTLDAYVSDYTDTEGSVFSPGILDKHNALQFFVGGFVSSLVGTMRRRKPGLGI